MGGGGSMKSLFFSIICVIFFNLTQIFTYNPEDIKNLMLNEKDLSNADFSDADLSNLDLSYKDFKQANFNNSILTNSKFDHSNLYKANFCFAKAQKTSFLGCNMKQANLNQANVKGAKFGDIKLKPWECADMDKVWILGADLSNSDLSNVRLTNCVYDKKTNFSEAQMVMIEINQKLFKNTIFEDVYFIPKPELKDILKEIDELKKIKITSYMIKRQCPTCKIKFSDLGVAAKLNCGHVFCKDCMDKQFSHDYKCPLCDFSTNFYTLIQTN